MIVLTHRLTPRRDFTTFVKTSCRRQAACCAKIYYPDKEERERFEKLGFKFVPSDFLDFRIDTDPITIEINSLEELNKLAKDYGDIILRPKGEIIIYNDDLF